MDSTPPPTPSAPPLKRRWLAAAGLALALAAYAFLLAHYMGAYAGGSDSSGYLNNARLLREGRLRVAQRAIEGLPPDAMPYFSYIPLGFTPVSSTAMVPTYPIGLSLLILGVSHVTGWEAAPQITLWLHALLGVILMFALARALGFSVVAATLGALLLGSSPLYLFSSLQAMSDTPALAWTTAAVYFAWLSRRHAGWALAAGLATAVAVLVRPTDLLVILPVAVCLGSAPRRWGLLVAGGLPGAVFLGVFNYQLYGKVLTTGYGDVGHAFGARFVPLVLANAAHWLPVLLTPAVVLALALPWLRRSLPPATRLLLAAWIAGFGGFYLFYFHTSETWWYLRFFLPAFPAVILAMLAAGRALAARWPARTVRVATAAAAIALVAWNGGWAWRKSALEIGRGERVYLEAATWARAHLPPRAVLACMQASGAFFHYTDFVLLRSDSDFSHAALARIERACAAAARPIYAAVFPFETKDALERALPGQWTQVGAIRQVTFWRRDGDLPSPVDPVIGREFVTARVGGAELFVETGSGWYDIEKSFRHRWIWSRGRGRLKVSSWPPKTSAVQLAFSLHGFAPTKLKIMQDGATLWRGEIGTDLTPVTLRVPLRDGVAQLECIADRPATPEGPGADARRLAFAVYDLSVSAP